ncbi:MAG: hypothetical protein ABR587_13965 [Candidatus Binatia bacterium]
MPNPSSEPAATFPRPRAASRALVAVLALAVVVAIGAAAARAGSCRVLVALGSVDMEPSPAGMSVRISGNWEFDNIVQVISGLSFNVLLMREDNFVRFHYPNQSYAGFVPGLAAEVDAGIDGSDILAVEAAGLPEPSARFVRFESQRMKLSSPVPPGDGPLSVVAYLVLDGDYVSPIISNIVTRPLEVEPPTANTEEEEPAPTPEPEPVMEPDPTTEPEPATEPVP